MVWKQKKFGKLCKKVETRYMKIQITNNFKMKKKLKYFLSFKCQQGKIKKIILVLSETQAKQLLIKIGYRCILNMN